MVTHHLFLHPQPLPLSLLNLNHIPLQTCQLIYLLKWTHTHIHTDDTTDALTDNCYTLY